MPSAYTGPAPKLGRGPALSPVRIKEILSGVTGKLTQKSFLRSAPLIMHRSVLDHAPCALVPPTGLLAGRMVCGEIWANPAPRRARFRQLQLIAIGGTGQPSVLDLAISGRLDGISSQML